MRCVRRQVLLPTGVSHSLEFCEVAPRAEGERAAEQNGGAPARILQNSEHRALARAELFCRTYRYIRSSAERSVAEFKRRLP